MLQNFVYSSCSFVLLCCLKVAVRERTVPALMALPLMSANLGKAVLRQNVSSVF